MAIEIVAGPAGSGKSQLVAAELDKERDVLIDFTRLWAAISGIDRLPDGRFPVRRRDDPRTGLVVSAKALLLEEALRRELEKSGTVFLTTSSRDELANLERRLPERTRARIIDPGEDAARARLAQPGNGGLEPECEEALRRWYNPRPSFGRRR